jgi:carboxyl-terminal processing protease
VRRTAGGLMVMPVSRRSLHLVITIIVVMLSQFPSSCDAAETAYKSLELFGKIFEFARTRYVDDVPPQKLVNSAARGLIAASRTEPGAVDRKQGGDTVAGAAPNDDAQRAMAFFGNLFERVQSQVNGRIDDDKLIASAVEAMLADLDPHSSYLDPKSFRDMQAAPEEGSGGVGVNITLRDGHVVVVSAIEDSPAARAGLRADDIIDFVNDDPAEGLSLRQVIDKLRGPSGSTVRLRILRKGVDRPIDRTVTREAIRQRSVVMRAIDDIGYLRLTQFNAQATDELKEAIARLQSQIPANGVKGYILDLRNNQGGLLDQAISVADAVLERGEIMTTRGRKPEDTQRYNAHAGDLLKGKPLIVLINGQSAAASEIVAGALQDQKRATLIGTRSFGSGTVQTIIPLGSGNGALRLTTARYFTPSGRSIEAKGISPDIEVVQDVTASTRADSEKRDETGLAAQPKGAGSESYVPTDTRDDKALQLAIGLLRGVRTDPAFPPNPKAVTGK